MEQAVATPQANDDLPRDIDVTLNMEQPDGSVLVLTKLATSVTRDANGHLEVGLFVSRAD